MSPCAPKRLPFSSGRLASPSHMIPVSRFAGRAHQIFLLIELTKISEDAQKTTDMQSLARVITQFARSLIPLDSVKAQVQSGETVRLLFLVHSLTHSAMLQLYNARTVSAAEGDLRDANVCLVHAVKILNVLEALAEGTNNGAMPVLDPIIGVRSSFY